MNQYKLYFEFYGRKMQTKVYANSKSEAMQEVLDKIIFIKTEKISDPTVEYMQNMFNMK